MESAPFGNTSIEARIAELEQTQIDASNELRQLRQLLLNARTAPVEASASSSEVRDRLSDEDAAARD